MPHGTIAIGQELERHYNQGNGRHKAVIDVKERQANFLVLKICIYICRVAIQDSEPEETPHATPNSADQKDIDEAV